MKLIVKYIKPFAFAVLLSLVLLFGQAVSDLTLPNLMSEIVSTGIQKGGIEEVCPEEIRAEGLTLLKLFMSGKQQAAIDAAYTLQSDNTYKRTAENGDALDAAGEAYNSGCYAMILYFQDMSQAQGEEAASADEEDEYRNIDLTELYQMIPMLQQMPEGSMDSYIETASNADGTIASSTGAVFTGLFYEELGKDVDKIQSSYIWKEGGKMLAVAMLGVAAAVLVSLISSQVAAKVAQKMRHDVFAKVNHFTGAEFDKFSTASLITRTTNDIQQVQMLVTMGMRLMCYAPIMGIGGVIMALNKSVSMSWIIAAAVIFMFGIIMVVFAMAMPKFKSLQKLIDKLNLVSRENLSGLMVIRAFGAEKHEEARFDEANRVLTGTQRFVQRTMAFMMPAMMFIMNLASIVIVWVGAKSIEASTLQIGDMMAFIQYAMQIIMSFLMIAMMFIMVPRASVSATRIKEVLETPISIQDPEKPVALAHVFGKIEFKDVTFKYGNAEENVIEHISFTANPGETTAFIGSTGSGKSTLINLIPRFYDVTEGSIEIDGVDIRNMRQEELRKNIGYIPQKGVLFSGDIASNIRYGAQEATDEGVMEAIEVAQASEFVSEKEEGIYSPIAQGATNVSGGQKQRLSIARALAMKPPIYIFDDSFSALDFKTDAALRKALEQYTGGATVLIVAQRVSTIMNAEQIIVLDGGKMVGKGTHAQLMESCPEYREIAQSQLGGGDNE